MSILAIIIIFSILIIIHEFGHFLAARMSGVRVERFAIGFGPALLKFKRKETEFLVCLFPLGGYVKLAGDSRLECSGAPDEFLSKPAGIKMRIVFAGPLFNYLLAFVIFWMSFTFIGFPSTKPVIGNTVAGYPAQTAGLKEGDKVLEVNNKEVKNWHQMAGVIQESEERVSLKIERGGQERFFDIPLKTEEMLDETGKARKMFVIGITAKVEKYNIFKSFVRGGEALYQLTAFIIKGFGAMITGKLPFKKAVAGPLGIFYFTSQAVQMGLVAILNLMIVLNISLTVVNLFPLPIIDGGHIIIFLIERIRRKPLSEAVENFLTRLGFVIIGLLFIFIFYNDIVRFGPKLWGKKTQNTEYQKGQGARNTKN
jgi:regulator of sigma E protease